MVGSPGRDRDSSRPAVRTIADISDQPHRRKGHDMRASVFPIAVVIALAFFGVACTPGGAEPEMEVEETFPAPTVVNPVLPVDPANATTSEQLANSDPC